MKEKERILMAYFAGAMDGDGSFSLCKKIDEKQGRSPLHYPFIQFGSLSEVLVDLFNENFDGQKVIIKSKTGKDGIQRKEFYSWRAEKSARCLAFLEKMCDFLVVKKERAVFLRDYILDNYSQQGSVRLSQETLSQREYGYMKMKQFNDSLSYNNTISKKKAKEVSTNKEFWAYFAGLLDTDGSFSIRKMKPALGRKSCGFSPIISLSMNDILGLNYIKENCPFGTIRIYKTKYSVQGFFNRLSIQSKEEVIQLIKLTLPYLRVKKDNARVLLDFCKNFTSCNHRQAGISEKELEFRENCYKKLICLNKYGVLKPSLIDLEILKQDDKAEDESHRERLSERDSKEYATV